MIYSTEISLQMIDYNKSAGPNGLNYKETNINNETLMGNNGFEYRIIRGLIE